MLPLKAPWFATAAGLGLWRVLRHRQGVLAWAFGALAVAGGLGQLLATPPNLLPQVAPGFATSNLPPGQSPNLLSPFLHGLLGWNPEEGGQRAAKAVGDGFWRIPQHSPAGRRYVEFFVDRWYPLEAGKTYTQSFYIRHDGSQARFTITFFTQRGHHPVPTQMEAVAPGVWRVWASYTAQEGDRAVRAIDFFNEGGDFTYLEVGWAQLEEGPTPTAYRMGPTGLKSLGWRLWWWVGVALLGFLVLQAGLWLFQSIPPSKAAWAILLGMLAHLAYAGWQWLEAGPGARVAGLTPQPNFLGHGAVMAAGLIWVLGGKRLGGVALGLAAALLFLSGSRTAFWALLLLGGAWAWSLGRSRPWVLGLAGLLGALALWQPELLGRLSQALTLDHSAQARLQFWQVAIQALRENPLGGIGFGHFPLYFDLNPPPNPIEPSPPHAHNLALHLLAEGGLLALLGLGIWLLGVGHALLKAGARPSLTLLGIALLLNLTDFSLFSAWVYYPLLLAVAFGLQKQHSPARVGL
ncbi:O-antigen ligase domain-containing protein [Meiothermus sp. QL-1]|nr:O-antigen ligase domain-containing protein [Meiothermus sp. QL-1]